MTTVLAVLWVLTAVGWWLDANGRHLGSTVPRSLVSGFLTLVADVVGGTPKSDVFPSEVTTGRRGGVGRWYAYWQMPGSQWTFTVWVETDSTTYVQVPVPRPTRNLEFTETESAEADPEAFTFTVAAPDGQPQADVPAGFRPADTSAPSVRVVRPD